MNGFLELTDAAPDAGAVPGGTASRDNSVLPEGDNHEFSDEWYTLDGEYHWRECECGFTTDRGAHEFVYVMDVEPTPTTTGWKHKECTVCGKQGSRIEVYYDEFLPPVPDLPTPPAEPTPTVWQNILTMIRNFFMALMDNIFKKFFA